MATFKNEFSWSKTRDEVFKTCPRQYWFAYYGFWNGMAGQKTTRRQKDISRLIREKKILQPLKSERLKDITVKKKNIK